jgi:hypothetical protein
LCLCHAGRAPASVRYVWTNSPSPGSGYLSWTTAARTIQDAVDAATAGDTVLVTNGTYQTGGRVIYGSLTNRVAIDRAIAVRSVNGAAVTVIRGAWHPGTTNGDSAVRCAYVTNGALLSGFTLAFGATRSAGDATEEQCGGGGRCLASGVISHCVLTSNSASRYGGGLFSGTISNCVISGNTAAWGGGAAYGARIHCTLSRNTASSGGGTYASAVTNCIVYYNTAPNGANCNGGTIAYSCTTPSPGGTGNITNEPQFVAASDYHLQPGSPCINAGNNAAATNLATDLDGNPRTVGGTVDMGAYEYQGVVYVATNGNDAAAGYSWATAKRTIQGGVDAAAEDDVVLVGNGTYSTGGRAAYGTMTNRVTIDRPLTVRSVNGPDWTWIVGQGVGTGGTNCGDGAVRCAYLTNGATLAGFTLSNGHTRASGDLTRDRSGGGVWCENGGTVSNCVISGNRGGYGGGGAHCHSGGTVANCTLRGNSAGLQGGGVQCWSGGVVVNCLLTGNVGGSYGGGVECYSGGAVRNCTVSANSASYGGGLDCKNGGTIVNTISYYNNQGGGADGANYTGIP